MAQKKAFEVDAWLARPSPETSIVLFYGPDRGLVAERARAFAVRTGLPLDDPFSVVRLDASEAEKGDGRLLDEARTVPMFSSKRLLWVRNAGGQKGFADDVKALCTEPSPDAIILIEAGELKKGAALRTTIEGSFIGMALPCYIDEAKGLDGIIDQELQKSGMAMSLDARQALRRSLGGDRLASRGEIEKLLLYAHGQKQIELPDVLASTGDVSALSVDEAVDAMLEGRVHDFDQAFGRHVRSGAQVFLLLAACMRQLHALQVMRGSMDETGKNAASAVASARPPVFYARKKLVENALSRWSREGLTRALQRIQSAILQTRKRADLSEPIARQAMLGIAIESARLSQRARA
ncbi:DNA polymerase III subunit delta [Mesorhizobium sp. SB112]|uniref:DNA polymerase III subunit delta n=2 Tax=Pseudomonadota TaxID=1224 RepID=UPI0032669F2C